MWPDCEFRWDTDDDSHTHQCIEPNDHEIEHMCDCGERQDIGHEVD